MSMGGANTGRREYRTALVEGKLRRGHVTRLPMASWKVCIPDRHAAYITWEEFLANQEKIESNRNVRHDGGVRGAAREGEALLQGLVLCGRCGYRLTVQQGGKAAARYLCTAPQMHGVSTKVCWSVSASRVDAIVARVFLQAVQPPEIELSLAVMREVERQASDLERQWKARLERARYEAQLAERRYKAVDPDNRVVARTLESEWEVKLREVEDLENASERARRTERLDLSDADRGEITRLARDLPRVWNAITTTNVQRKRLVRLLVQQVTLTPIDVPRRMTRVQILWHTGAVTDVSTERPRYIAGRVAADEIVEEIRRRVEESWSDTAIAADFNRRAVASPMGRTWNKQTVRGLRKRREICSKNAPPEGGRWPTRRADGLISLRGVAQRYGVPRGTVRFWVAKGVLVPVEGGGHGRPLWFLLDANTERRLAAVSKAVRRYQSAYAGGEV